MGNASDGDVGNASHRGGSVGTTISERNLRETGNAGISGEVGINEIDILVGCWCQAHANVGGGSSGGISRACANISVGLWVDGAGACEGCHSACGNELNTPRSWIFGADYEGVRGSGSQSWLVGSPKNLRS